MKLYEINHVNESVNPNAVMGLALYFTASICPLSGDKREAIRQPHEWDYVKRLTNMLFYAWDETNPLEGTVHLGDLR